MSAQAATGVGACLPFHRGILTFKGWSMPWAGRQSTNWLRCKERGTGGPGKSIRLTTSRSITPLRKSAAASNKIRNFRRVDQSL